MALMPMTTRRLKILEPTTFPMAMSLLPFMAAVTLTASSGALVPNATIVSPIMREGMCSLLAIQDAPSTKISAPFTSSKKPIQRIRTDVIIGFSSIELVFSIIP